MTLDSYTPHLPQWSPSPAPAKKAQLINANEVGRILDCTRGTISYYMYKKGMPMPVRKQKGGMMLWDKDAILKWSAATPRRKLKPHSKRPNHSPRPKVNRVDLSHVAGGGSVAQAQGPAEEFATVSLKAQGIDLEYKLPRSVLLQVAQTLEDYLTNQPKGN